MFKHKKTIVAGLSLLAILVCGTVDGWGSILDLHALAQNAGGNNTNTPSATLFTNSINFVVMITTAMEFLSFMIFTFLQLFLDPLFILSVNETEALRDIWKYSRDLVNVIFAFMLIFAGIYTVVTGQKELVQQKYKKFILAVILVNFSWFFPRVILDVANVLTATVYQLPSGLLQDNELECKRFDGKPCQVIANINWFDDCDPLPPGYIAKIDKVLCYETQPWNSDINTSYGMLNGLVVNYGHLPELTRVINPGTTAAASTPEERLAEILKFMLRLFFILALMTMLFLPLIAMFIVFLIRIPIMWFTIAFMPFMFIGFVIGDKLGQFDTMKIFSHYVKAAFLPTVVAVPFAVGFMIITEFMRVDCSKLGIVNDAGFCKTTGPFLTNISTLWELLILFMAFIVIWAGFWMALKIDDIYVNATSGIKSFGETLGKAAIKAPLSVPFIPAGKGKSVSILGVDDIVRKKNAELSGGAGLFGGGNKGGKADSDLSRAFDDGNSETNRRLDKILNELETKKKGGDAVTKTDVDVKLQQLIESKEVRAEIGDNVTTEDVRQKISEIPKFSRRLEKILSDDS